MRVFVRASACVCVCECVCTCEWDYMRVCLCECVHAQLQALPHGRLERTQSELPKMRRSAANGPDFGDESASA